MAYAEIDRNFPERKPAIEPNLVFKEGPCKGLHPNKCTMLTTAFVEGLPVQSILSVEQAKEILKTKRAVWERGYFDECVDMWAVDTLKTTPLSGLDRFIIRGAEDYKDQTYQDNSNLYAYLSNNFDVRNLTPRYFYQLPIPIDHANFSSIMTLGPYTFFITRADNYDGGGTSWLYWYDGQLNRSQGDIVMLSHASGIEENLFPIIKKAKQIFDQNLEGDFAYKYDLLSDPNFEDFSLIQSRIACPNNVGYEVAMMENKIRQAGYPIVNYGIKDGDSLFSLAEGQPYVLKLRNNSFGRIKLSGDKFHFQDLRNIAGLILPAGLRRGMLDHGAYRIIAYALYWGLPITFE